MGTFQIKDTPNKGHAHTNDLTFPSLKRGQLTIMNYKLSIMNTKLMTPFSE